MIKMMKKLVLFFISISLLVGCTEMNDKHDEFLARGETVYIGKVDSVVSFPGKGRLLLRYWISDPRAKNVTLYWGVNDVYSKTLTIAQHSSADALEAFFDENDEGFSEGNHTFHWISSDLYGNKSMVFEMIASVYDALYQEKLLNRRVVETNPADNGDVEITWASASSEEEIGIEIFYTDIEGNSFAEYYPQFGTSMTLENVDFTQGITYRTLYKPEPLAIDTFYTNIAKVDIIKTINVALGKPVTCSDINDPSSAAQQPENAVDGNYATNATRWVATVGGPHWLEIDLQGEYSISSFKTWNGSGGYNYPIGNIELQAWIDGQWVIAHSVSGNTDSLYGADFAPVTTDKVRFFTPNEVRLFEIAVYSVIRY